MTEPPLEVISPCRLVRCGKRCCAGEVTITAEAVVVKLTSLP